MTCKEKEWVYLKRMGSLTTRGAYQLFGHMRLPDYVHKWRKRGIVITSKRESTGRKSWNRYFLDRFEAERAEKEGLV